MTSQKFANIIPLWLILQKFAKIAEFSKIVKISEIAKMAKFVQIVTTYFAKLHNILGKFNVWILFSFFSSQLSRRLDLARIDCEVKKQRNRRGGDEEETEISKFSTLN